MTLFQVRYLPERHIARAEGQGRADGWPDQFMESADKLAHEALIWPMITSRRGRDIRSKLAVVRADPSDRGQRDVLGVWTGVCGDATLATLEKGRVVVEAMVEGILEDIHALRSA